MTKQRYSGFELLRIIMILQIIFLHLCDKGGYSEVASNLPAVHYNLYYFVWLLCRCPVYAFMMLTGYFLVKKQMNVKTVMERIKKVYLPMLFYAISINLAGIITGWWTFGEINHAKMFIPFLGSGWYFLTGYILIVIFSPFLNKLANNLTKKEYTALIIILTLVLSIWTPLASFKPLHGFLSTSQNIYSSGGKSLYDYIFMYLLGGYISLHIKKKNKIQFRYLLIFLLCGIIQFSLATLYKDYVSLAGCNDNIFVVIQTVMLILFFRELNFYSKFINYIASFAISVYIIHEQYTFKWHFWTNLLHLDITFFNTYFYPLKVIGICVGIYTACVFIDLFRRAIFKVCGYIYSYIKKGVTVDNKI